MRQVILAALFAAFLAQGCGGGDESRTVVPPPAALSAASLAPVTPGRVGAPVPVPIPVQATTVAAAAPSATQVGNVVQVANQFVSISVNSQNGAIQSIVDRATGLNLTAAVQPGVNVELWGLAVSDAGGTAYAGNWSAQGAPTVTLQNSATDASAILTWQGFSLTSGKKIGTATVVVTITVKAGDPLSHWNFEAHGLGGLDVTRLSFPTLGTVGQLGAQASDNSLLIPQQGGRLATDPIGNGASIWLDYPSAAMSMQFAAFYNSQAGFYLGTRDTGGQTKAMNWWPNSSPAHTANWHIAHDFPDEAAQDLVLPYETVIGVFHGDWTAAADLYKAWALQQSWVQNVRQIPAWLRNTPYGTSQCVHGCGGTSQDTYATLTNVQSADFGALGGSSLVFLSGWEQHGAWFYGDALPPAEGWSSFDQMAATLHAQGNYLRLDVGGSKLEDVAPLWTSGQALAGVALNKDGTPIDEYTTIYGYTHHWYQMSPSSQVWRDALSAQVAGLASHGVDSISFDGWPISGIQDDYSAGHPPGRGGNWQWQAWESLLKSVESAAFAVRPDLAFSTEEGDELLLPYVTFFDKRDNWAEINNYANQYAPVPLFDYVYKPYSQSGPGDYWPWLWSDKPDSFHLLVFGRSLVWGTALPFLYSRLNDPAQVSTRALNYYRAVGAARSRYAKFLVDGSMLPPPAISSSTTTVAMGGDASGAIPNYSGTAASVQAGAWRSSDGDTAIVLTNIGTANVAISVPVDFDLLKLTGGQTYAVRIDQAGTTECLDTVGASATFPVSLDPQQIAALTMTPGSCMPPPEQAKSDCLFNWAEGVFPSLLTPATPASQTFGPYYFRAYPSTNFYVGVSAVDDHVYYLNGGSIHDLGTLDTWSGTAACR